MKQIFGIYDYEKKEYTDNSEAVYSYTDLKLDIKIIGRAETDGKINCGEKLAEIFVNSAKSFTEFVSGAYIAVIFDKSSRVLWVFHDRSTSPFVLYYIESGNKVYIGTSLKTIIKNSKAVCKFNEKSVEEFIVNGYIYGRDTLIDGISKIEAFHCLKISEGKVEQLEVEYGIAEMTKGEALDSFQNTLDAAIEKCFIDEEEINLPLSSGFDSNYIAYIACKNGCVPVNAFSVGGKFGKNELPAVKENVKCYERINLECEYTDCDTLQNLPDIVWRLEGSVYEVGLFLQYELAELVAKKGKKYLICGECADQVMNKYYLDDSRIHPTKNSGETLYYEFSEYPYIFGNYLILKKNGILANSFGIETRYPYLDNDVVAASYALRNINEKDKRVHTANCSEVLPEAVLRNMSKIGGATEFHSLFNSKNDIKDFCSRVEKSEFYRSYIEVIKRHSYIESQKQTGIRKFKTIIRNFVKKLFGIRNEQNEYFNEEMKLKEYMCIAYLIIFEKLFISEKYRDKFDSAEIPVALRDIL